ncbi:MAG: hypothetical protein GY863_04775 [bacterium]|nr:hypothetical protein [bacterium]
MSLFAQIKYVQRSLAIVFVLILSIATTSAAQVSKLTGDEIEPGVYGKIYLTEKEEPAPGIIIMHGSAGLRKNYYDYSEKLAKNGYNVLLIDYFAETGDAPAGSQKRFELWKVWQNTLINSAAYFRKQPGVIENEIGIIGFSRGAWVAFTCISDLPDIKLIIDYYGVGGQSLDPVIKDLPPVLMLYGDQDRFAGKDFIKSIYKKIGDNGNEVELKIYPDTGHSFNFSPDKDEHHRKASLDSYKEVLEFLKKHLANSGR